jgi:cell division protein FtsB
MARTPPADEGAAEARPSSRRLFRVFVSSVVAIGIVFTFVNPTRQWLDQRGSIAAAHERVAVLDEKSGELTDRAAQLRTDAEIERLAREQYGLVKPGEEAYAILPGPATPPPAAAAKPAPKRSTWQMVRDTLTFWD